jgi:hypothetical protein
MESGVTNGENGVTKDEGIVAKEKNDVAEEHGAVADNENAAVQEESAEAENESTEVEEEGIGAKDWYVIHVYSGFENKVKLSLEERFAQKKSSRFGVVRKRSVLASSIRVMF